MDFATLVQKARSCRRFVEAAPLPQGTLASLVDCARIAPSAANAQPLRYMLCEGGAVSSRVFPLIRWAAYLKDWNGPAEGERPTGYIIVLGPAEGGSRVQCDLGIAAQTIQLAATAADLGCCMIGAFDKPALCAMFPMPEGLAPLLLIAVGQPAEERVLDLPGPDDDIRYWRDARGIHHVPKRSLETVVVARFGDHNV